MTGKFSHAVEDEEKCLDWKVCLRGGSTADERLPWLISGSPFCPSSMIADRF